METCYSLAHHDDIEGHGCCDGCGLWGSQLDNGQACNCRECVDMSHAIRVMFPQDAIPPF